MSDSDWSMIQKLNGKKTKGQKDKRKINEEPFWPTSENVTAIKKSFSSMMKSPMVTLQIPLDLERSDETESWFVHSDLLQEESEKLRAYLPGENIPPNGTVIQIAEDPKLFNLFIDYLYCKGKAQWTIERRSQELQNQRKLDISSFNCQPSDLGEEAAALVTLARLYLMGWRLGASRFQTTNLVNIRCSLQAIDLSVYWMVRLLRVVALGLRSLTRLGEDVLGRVVLSYTVKNLGKLQSYIGFVALLSELPHLAVDICLHAQPIMGLSDGVNYGLDMDTIPTSVDYYAPDVTVLMEELTGEELTLQVVDKYPRHRNGCPA